MGRARWDAGSAHNPHLCFRTLASPASNPRIHTVRVLGLTVVCSLRSAPDPRSLSHGGPHRRCEPDLSLAGPHTGNCRPQQGLIGSVAIMMSSAWGYECYTAKDRQGINPCRAGTPGSWLDGIDINHSGAQGIALPGGQKKPINRGCHYRVGVHSMRRSRRIHMYSHAPRRVSLIGHRGVGLPRHAL